MFLAHKIVLPLNISKYLDITFKNEDSYCHFKYRIWNKRNLCSAYFNSIPK